MQETAFIFSILLLIPYLGWGVHTLRLRYQFHEELPLRVEVITMVCLLAYYALEIYMFDRVMSTTPVLYVFTVLGLAISGMALYGHIVISVVSRIIVDAVLPNDDLNTVGPRFGPAESLERRGDYEGALQEYLVIARIFPKDPATSIRVGNTYAELKRPTDAVIWFERAMHRVDDADRALTIANRLSALYDELNDPEHAASSLEAFLKKFPTSEFSDRVRLRLARRRQVVVEPKRDEDLPPSSNLLRL